MDVILSIFGKTPFFELVCVLTATEKSLTHMPAVDDNSIYVERHKNYVYSRRCKAVLLFHETHEIIE